MSEAAPWLGFLAAGLIATPHCLAMCGPLLCGFARLIDTRTGVAASRLHRAAYHAGRVWTYSLLGLAVGGLGSRVAVPVLQGWQVPVGIVAVALLAGLWLRGELWRGDPGREWGWLPQRIRDSRWLGSLAAARGLSARFLLGTLMGLLPCGMVYAMLIPAATMGSPAAGAAGMLLFGVGTVPALSVAQWILTRPGSERPWVRRLMTPALLVVAASVVLLRLR